VIIDRIELQLILERGIHDDDCETSRHPHNNRKDYLQYEFAGIELTGAFEKQAKLDLEEFMAKTS
jgi:hypothetical protein